MSAQPSHYRQVEDGHTFRTVSAIDSIEPTPGQLLEAQSAGELLAEWLTLLSTAILTRDPEEGTVMLDWVDVDGRRHRCQGEHASDLLRRALGREPKQRCLTCKVEKPLGCFGLDKNRPLGRLPRCKPCEAARVRKYKERGRARKIAAALQARDHDAEAPAAQTA